MKISRKILCTTFFIICACTNLTFAKTGTVKIEATRIREQANTTSNIVNVIYEDDEVEILEDNGEWCKIKFKNDTGYVKKEFLNIKESSTTSNTTPSTSEEQAKPNNVQPQETENPSTPVVEVYAKLLPSFVSKDTFKIDYAKPLEEIEELNNWVKVLNGENSGWILKTKLQPTTQTEEPVKEPEPQVSAGENKVSNTVVENEVSNTTVNNTSSEVTNTSNNAEQANSMNKKATITVETAIVREKATTDSEPIGYLDYGDEITLLEQTGDWYKIKIDNKTGYVKNTLLKINDTSVSSRSLKEERKEQVEDKKNEETKTVSDVAEYAKQYLGYPYIVGGKTPNTGFDCSGFTRYVFLNFGYTLGSTASSQANVGTEIDRNDIKSGDLLLFQNEEKTGIGHTGIYIENGEFIHAANPDRGIVTDNLNTNSYYNERFISARRIVK